MRRMRVSDYIMEVLYSAGAKHIFFIPGTGNMFLTDALAKNPDVQPISVHHEQAAGMAAVGYAKYNNTLGACVVTTGCGGTNAMTPLVDSWQDSVPCVFVSGQARRDQTTRLAPSKVRQMGRQEVDIIAIVQPVTKYAVMLDDAESSVYEIEKAVYMAREGRPGPSWIDVPMDIQNSIIDVDALEHFTPPTDTTLPSFTEDDARYIMDELANAERPILLLGNGIRLADAIGDLKVFIDKYRIPATYSKLAPDILETDSDCSIGMVGMLGSSRSGNFAIQNSDLVLCLGCRLSIDTTGYEYAKFARAAKVIVVDIDKEEHSKQTVRIDRLIISDVKQFLQHMNGQSAPREWTQWAEKCRHWKEHFPTMLPEWRHGERINEYHLVEALSNVMPDDTTVITAAGSLFFTVPATVNIKGARRMITSAAQAEMGFPLPAAIGVSLASDAPVVALDGDGSFMMNIQELQTLSHLKRNVKICVTNNNGYASIRGMQNAAFRGRYIGCDPTSGVSFPDLELVAKAFGIDYMKIEGSDDLESKVAKIFDTDAPLLCEVMCVEEQKFLGVAEAMNSKKRFVTRPLEDQSPWLDRDDFLAEMIVEPIDQ